MTEPQHPWKLLPVNIESICNNTDLVKAELFFAKEMHPHFIDKFTRLPKQDIDTMLDDARHCLAMLTADGMADFHAVLICELYEALAAYAEGDLRHAKQELAQCAAVCLRGMEYLDNEIKTKEGETK